jgi:hypothetical protein
MSVVQMLRKAFASYAAAALVSFLPVTAANAVTFSLSSGGTPSVLPVDFNPSNIGGIIADGVNVGTPITIFSGVGNTGGLLLSLNDVAVTFTFMGKEAGYTNQLLIGNSVVLTNNMAPGTSSAAFTFSSGPLPFLFRAVTPGNLDAINGSSVASGIEVAFAKVSDSTFYAFFDDGGAGPDRDFDDMVVKITDPVAAPLPAALPLFATGLGMLGLFARRRKQKAQAAA